MRNISIIFSVVISMCTASANAITFDADDPQFLVQSCQEVLEVYKNRDEMVILAGQMTSVSEALRAGYCIGVVKQYLRTNKSCSRYNQRQFRTDEWYEFAKAVANISFGKNALSENTSTKRLLKGVYCDG